MIKIVSESDIDALLASRLGVLFFHADWSQYSVIGKQMTEFVETRAKKGKRDITFFETEACDNRAIDMISAARLFLGALGVGSLSFFQNGKCVHTVTSVIGEGTFEVWRLIDRFEPKGKDAKTPA